MPAGLPALHHGWHAAHTSTFWTQGNLAGFSEGFPFFIRALSLAKTSRSSSSPVIIFTSERVRPLPNKDTGSRSARGKTSLNLHSGHSVCLTVKCAVTVTRTSQTQRLTFRPSPFNDLPQYKSCLLELKHLAKSASVYKASWLVIQLLQPEELRSMRGSPSRYPSHTQPMT